MEFDREGRDSCRRHVDYRGLYGVGEGGFRARVVGFFVEDRSERNVITVETSSHSIRL